MDSPANENKPRDLLEPEGVNKGLSDPKDVVDWLIACMTIGVDQFLKVVIPLNNVVRHVYVDDIKNSRNAKNSVVITPAKAINDIFVETEAVNRMPAAAMAQFLIWNLCPSSLSTAACR